jgi:hypothetical protein
MGGEELPQGAEEGRVVGEEGEEVKGLDLFVPLLKLEPDGRVALESSEEQPDLVEIIKSGRRQCELRRSEKKRKGKEKASPKHYSCSSEGKRATSFSTIPGTLVQRANLRSEGSVLKKEART